mmetsp:Transcript_12488/g.32649  ORF Transcript_12488/g.32649 Transcript_12488/m.32649 type:complete len:288 (+) Transcript_12488:565-1428(+)
MCASERRLMTGAKDGRPVSQLMSSSVSMAPLLVAAASTCSMRIDGACRRSVCTSRSGRQTSECTESSTLKRITKNSRSSRKRESSSPGRNDSALCLAARVAKPKPMMSSSRSARISGSDVVCHTCRLQSRPLICRLISTRDSLTQNRLKYTMKPPAKIVLTMRLAVGTMHTLDGTCEVATKITPTGSQRSVKTSVVCTTSSTASGLPIALTIGCAMSARGHAHRVRSSPVVTPLPAESTLAAVAVAVLSPTLTICAMSIRKAGSARPSVIVFCARQTASCSGSRLLS